MKRMLTGVCVLALVACAGEPPPTPTLPANCAWEVVMRREHPAFGTSDHAEVFVKQGDSWRLELSLPAADAPYVFCFSNGETTVSDERAADLVEEGPLTVVSSVYEMLPQAKYRGIKSIHDRSCYYYRFKDELSDAHIYLDVQSSQPRHLDMEFGAVRIVADYYDIEVPDADLFGSDAMTPLFEPRHWPPP